MLTTALITVHLIGLAIGLGGATIGDLAVLRAALRHQQVPNDLLRDLSMAIWIGLAILFASGFALFGLDPRLYLHLSGFVAKMIIVAVLVANGALLHRRVGEFKPSAMMLLAGAISSVSWYGSLVIAMFKTKVSLSVADYLSLYVLAVVVVWRTYGRLFHKCRFAADLQSGHIAESVQAAPQPQLTD